MKGHQLLRARQKNGWSQLEVADRLGVSQPYLSLLEKEIRPVTKNLERKAFRVFKLPATELSFSLGSEMIRPVSDTRLASDLAALGYPGFSHLQPSHPKNPHQVLLTALSNDDLDSRIVEALPWLMLTFNQMNWEEWQQVIRLAKVDDLQNRLGFVANVARRMAEQMGEHQKALRIERVEQRLERSRLVREDTLCHNSLTETEKRWLRENRPPAAEHWNLLTDLSPNHLNYLQSDNVKQFDIE